MKEFKDLFIYSQHPPTCAKASSKLSDATKNVAHLFAYVGASEGRLVEK